MVAMTVTAALAAEGIYFLAANGVTTVLGSGSDPFQPSIIAFNIGAVACGYLAGVALVQPRRSRRVKAVVRSGSDNAYGIYLSHMIFITMLTWVGWAKLGSVIPWPLLCLVTVAIVFALGMALTSFLARTPLAVPLTGRTQMPGGCRGSSRPIPPCSRARQTMPSRSPPAMPAIRARYRAPAVCSPA
jgi:peptidoglycan/LPS O-acetylase OafA/YrhL